MDLSRVIVGQVVTEKAERIKADRSHTLRVLPDATKVDVINALKRFYDVDVTSVRMIRVPAKSREVGPYRTFTKRPAYKKAVVTLGEKSKGLDLSNFKA